MRPKLRQRNPFARALAFRLYRRRIVRAKKGKGSYKRRPKHFKGRRFFRANFSNDSTHKGFSLNWFQKPQNYRLTRALFSPSLG